MAGQLDSLLKSVAKDIVATLGDSLDTTITYTKKASGTYNTSTGAYTTTDVSYSISVPIEFIRSEEDEGKEIREAKMYITPDLIGDNQIDFDDEVQFSYAGSTVTGQIYDIDTKKGNQVYLYTILVRF